jgi:hypothetical protein
MRRAWNGFMGKTHGLLESPEVLAWETTLSTPRFLS